MVYVRDLVKFWGYDGQFWAEVPGDDDYITIDPNSKVDILNDLDSL